MSYSIAGRKLNHPRRSNIRELKLSKPISHSSEGLKKKSSSSLLWWLLLGIFFVSIVYLSFVFHVTVTPTTISNISSKLREIESLTVNTLRHQIESYNSSRYSHNALNYGESNDRTTTTTVSRSNPPTDLPSRCPDRKPVPLQILPTNRSEKGASNMHFIHIPKCGGTSMTAVLREMACSMNPSVNVDCCKNPGFCDWHAFRRCSVIKGCTDHFPNRAWIYKPQPSIALFREPTSRLLHLLLSVSIMSLSS